MKRFVFYRNLKPNMKRLFYIIILLFAFQTEAQTIIQKSFSAEKLSAIHINGNFMFHISIETTASNTIEMVSRVEGENSEHVVLVTEIKNNTLYVSSKFQPLFADANDKLSAHKVMSIELTLSIPENQTVYIVSDIASIEMKGKYNSATVELTNGDCILNPFQGQAVINTIQGAISVHANFAKVDAFTKHGVLHSEALSSGNHLLSLHSINGDITITKSQ